jgi:hypothetical protein
MNQQLSSLGECGRKASVTADRQTDFSWQAGPDQFWEAPQGVEHVLLVPRMAPVGVGELRGVKDQLMGYRNDIVAALDFLFLGV